MRQFPVLLLAGRGACQAALYPFVKLAEPASTAVIAGVADERNLVGVRVLLHFYDVHELEPAQLDELAVWFRVDRSAVSPSRCLGQFQDTRAKSSSLSLSRCPDSSCA